MNRIIKKIYNGLPEELVDKVFWVSMEYRTNPLSRIPGGSDVVIEYQDDEVLGYERVKFPDLYIDRIIGLHIIGFENLHSCEKLQKLKSEVRSISVSEYYEDESEATIQFKEIWNYKISNTLPLEKKMMKLKDFFKAIGVESLHFRKGRGLKFCSTSVGVVFVSKDYDQTKDAYIATNSFRDGITQEKNKKITFWLINKKDSTENNGLISIKDNGSHKCISVDKFMEIIDLKELKFRKYRGKEICVTPAGLLYKHPDFIDSEVGYIARVEENSKELDNQGVFWLVNKIGN